jgi:protein-disulfide isomerase
MGLVTVTAFEDLACGDCADYAHMLDAHLAPKYGRRVSFEHRDFPLARHEWAYAAAVAARFLATRSPASAHRFRRYCMRERHRIASANLARHFENFAREAGVEAPPFAEVAADDPSRAAVERDLAEGRQRGVEKTPTVFAGDAVLVELFELEEITAAIEAALAAANSGSGSG